MACTKSPADSRHRWKWKCSTVWMIWGYTWLLRGGRGSPRCGNLEHGNHPLHCCMHSQLQESSSVRNHPEMGYVDTYVPFGRSFGFSSGRTHECCHHIWQLAAFCLNLYRIHSPLIYSLAHTVTSLRLLSPRDVGLIVVVGIDLMSIHCNIRIIVLISCRRCEDIARLSTWYPWDAPGHRKCELERDRKGRMRKVLLRHRGCSISSAKFF